MDFGGEKKNPQNKTEKNQTCNSRQIILQASAVPIKADIFFLWKYILKC